MEKTVTSVKNLSNGVNLMKLKYELKSSKSDIYIKYQNCLQHKFSIFFYFYHLGLDNLQTILKFGQSRNKVIHK